MQTRRENVMRTSVYCDLNARGKWLNANVNDLRLAHAVGSLAHLLVEGGVSEGLEAFCPGLAAILDLA